MLEWLPYLRRTRVGVRKPPGDLPVAVGIVQSLQPAQRMDIAMKSHLGLRLKKPNDWRAIEGLTPSFL